MRADGLRRVLDGTAVGLSGLCMVHCLALPVAAGFLPLAGAWAEAEWVHLAFLAAAVPTSILALWKSGGWADPVTAGLAAVGLSGLAMGAVAFPSHDWETALTVAGGLLLAAAHVRNWRRGHRHG